jgi:hypothetical protein
MSPTPRRAAAQDGDTDPGGDPPVTGSPTLSDADHEAIASKLFSKMGGSGGGGRSSTAPVASEATTSEPQTRREIQDEARRVVEDALADHQAEEAERDHQAQHRQLSKLSERAPETVNKLGRALWGAGKGSGE